VAKSELCDPGIKQVVILWVNRFSFDMPEFHLLQDLSLQFPSKFILKVALSREKKEGYLHGRASPELLQSVFQHFEKPSFLVVGTKEMKRQGYKYIKLAGFQSFNILLSIKLMGKSESSPLNS